jgi:hypothetical protein
MGKICALKACDVVENETRKRIYDMDVVVGCAKIKNEKLDRGAGSY